MTQIKVDYPWKLDTLNNISYELVRIALDICRIVKYLI